MAKQSTAPRCTHGAADEVIRRRAALQHGMVSRRQLLADGVPDHVIDRRLSSGALRRVHAGVYQVGPIAGPRAAEVAALLACEADAVCLYTAAALLDIVSAQPQSALVDLAIPTCRHPVRRPGIRVHRIDLQPGEITLLDGVRMTTAARTLLDLSRVMTVHELELAVVKAQQAGLLSAARLEGMLQQDQRRPGTARLRMAVHGARTLGRTRSRAEQQAIGLFAAAKLPPPEVNVTVEGFIVDFAWPAERIIVEVDGFRWHSSRRVFLRDRQRNTALAAAGWDVIRLTWHQIEREAVRTGVELALTFARRR